jgi:uncharacterized protein
MSQNLDMLKKGYEDFAKGDMDAVKETWAEDIRWEGPNAEGLPGSGTHEGHDGVEKMIGELNEAYDPFKVAPDEFLDAGDTIVVLGHNEATVKSSGNDIKVPFVHIWRISDGKVKRVQSLTDTAVVRDAHEG